jgi:hypothetical protein
VRRNETDCSANVSALIWFQRVKRDKKGDTLSDYKVQNECKLLFILL